MQSNNDFSHVITLIPSAIDLLQLTMTKQPMILLKSSLLVEWLVLAGIRLKIATKYQQLVTHCCDDSTMQYFHEDSRLVASPRLIKLHNDSLSLSIPAGLTNFTAKSLKLLKYIHLFSLGSLGSLLSIATPQLQKLSDLLLIQTISATKKQ